MEVLLTSSTRARLFTLAAVTTSALAFRFYARVARPWLVLGWVGLVPWLAVLERTSSVGGAVAAGLAMDVAFALAVFGWFREPIAAYTGASTAVALLVLAAVSPLLEPQFVGLAVARHLTRRRGAGFWRTALAGACAYVVVEAASGKLFTDTLGHGLYASTWMRQAADVAGAPGLTLVLLIANECVLAATLAARSGRIGRALAPAACVAALALALAGYGAARCRQLAAGPREEAPVAAGIVQADISQYDRMRADLGTFAAVRAVLDAHFGLSSDLLARRALDLLVWPETVYPTTFGAPKSPDGAAFDREIAAFVAGTRVPLVFGSYDAEDGDEFNAAVFLEPQAPGRLAFDTYRKASLFPLTERVPAALEYGLVRRWLPWLGTWKPGSGGEVIALALPDGRTVRIAPLICYDALDPRYALAAVRAGAELIVTLSNDSWFDAGPGPRLHLVGAAFRSIETRRPQLRATNTGISAVIDATGEIVASAGVHERTTLTGRVRPEHRATTPILRWGDWLAPVALALGILLLVAP